MKPKEYLVKHGHLAEAGRGRLSKEHVAIIQDAVSKGVFIEGYTRVKEEPKATAPVQPKVVKVPKEDIADIGEPLRDERSFTASSSGTPVGMRTVCNICRNSLTYCPCPAPRVWLDFDREGVVVFATRKPTDR